MVVLEIAPNENCDPVDLRVFHNLQAPRAITQMCMTRDGQEVWCDITGWTQNNTPCPAYAQEVDDSGEGVAILVYGGDAGLRFRDVSHREDWGIDQDNQWGESFIITTDSKDLEYVELTTE